MSVQNLLQQAKAMAPKRGRGPGKRYSPEFKAVIIALIKEHQLPIARVSALTSVSACSINHWCQKKSNVGKKKTLKNQFRKISIQKNQSRRGDSYDKILSSIKTYLFLIVTLQALLIAGLSIPYSGETSNDRDFPAVPYSPICAPSH